MKLSTMLAKLTGTSFHAVRTFAIVAVAASAMLANSPRASAQHVAFGVHFGGPRYVAPLPPRPAYGYYAPRYNDWRAHEAWVRHDEWQRFHHQPYPYGYAPRPYGYRPN